MSEPERIEMGAGPWEPNKPNPLFEIQIEPDEGFRVMNGDPMKRRYWRVRYRALGQRQWVKFLVERPDNVTIATLQEMCAKHVAFIKRR